jgi:hypothetical protein
MVFLKASMAEVTGPDDDKAPVDDRQGNNRGEVVPSAKIVPQI